MIHAGAVPGGRDIASWPPVPSSGPGRAGFDDLWRLGRLLQAEATGAGALLWLHLHADAWPRLAGLTPADPGIVEAVCRRALAGVGGCGVTLARAAPSAWLAWLPQVSDAPDMCERWLTAKILKTLQVGSVRVRCQPGARWVVWPTDGPGRAAAFERLDHGSGSAGTARPGAGTRAQRPSRGMRATPIGGCPVGARQLLAEPVVDLVSGRLSGWRIPPRAPVGQEPAARDGAACREPTPAPVDDLPVPSLAPSRNIGRIDLSVPLDTLEEGRLASALRQRVGAAPRPVCVLLPESLAWHTPARVETLARQLAARGLAPGLDDYRGWIAPRWLARAGLRRLRLHPGLLAGLGEYPWCEHRLGDLLRRAHACRLEVVVTNIDSRSALVAAQAAGAREVAGSLFGPARRLPAAAVSRLACAPAR